jgi:hypothetical protein
MVRTDRSSGLKYPSNCLSQILKKMRILVVFETSRVDGDHAVKRVAVSSFRCQAVGRNPWIASIEG